MREVRAAMSCGLRPATRSAWGERYPVFGWVLQAGLPAFSGLGLLVVTEAALYGARSLHLAGPRWGLDHRVSPDVFEAFVAALVGSLAAFLALFFTTLGVIAAGAYADVPDPLRIVFLRDRQNTVYMATVVRALVFGTALLAGHAIGYRPYSATILVFAVLCLLSVLGSAALGVGLFSFFDLTKLAEPLPKRFLAAADQAAVRADGRYSPEQEQATHDEAAGALRIRRDALRLITERGGTRTTAPDALRSTLDTWARYAERKPAIPTNSAWFARNRIEPNWLTLNPFEAQDPLAASTPRIQIAADLLWAERELAEHYVTLLRPVVQGEDWATALDCVTPTSELACVLIADLQVREALLLCQAASSVIDHAYAAATPHVDGDQAPDRAQRRRFRTATVQAGLLVRGQMWLGLAAAAQRVADPEVGDRLEHAAHAPNNPAITATLPISRDLRTLLDAMATGLTIERQAEGEEITPGWWLRHLAARTLTWSLHDTAAQLLEDLHAYLPARCAVVAALADAEAHVTLLLGALNTIHRAEVALEHVEQATARLAALRRDAASDEPWSDWKPNRSALAARRVVLLRDLASATARLSVRPHLDDEPDLLGRAYLAISDSLFHVMMDGDQATSAMMFPQVMKAALHAHQRVLADMGDQPVINYVIHSGAPLIDLMQLSGYALLLHEVDGDGSWPAFREAWERQLRQQNFAPALVRILEQRHHQVPADIRRQPWERRFEQRLADHGLVDSGPGSARWTHPSPVVRAVLGQSVFRTYLMADLFVLEYLVTRPGAETLQPGRYVSLLSDALAREHGEDHGDD
jgi:hypothetical protein